MRPPLTISEEMEINAIILDTPLITPKGLVTRLEHGVEVIVEKGYLVDSSNGKCTHRIFACFATLDLKVLRFMAFNQNNPGQIDVVTVTRNGVNNNS